MNPRHARRAAGIISSLRREATLPAPPMFPSDPEAIPVKILILPDSFKGSLSAHRACAAIEAAAREVFPEAELNTLPLADGGEGTLELVQHAAGGAFLPVEVTGPCGQRVRARYLSIGDTAVIELAEAAGLGLRLPGYSPLRTTTFGVGQLIGHALQVGHRRIVVALGGSATTDAGCGMAAALGTQFLDESGRSFIPTGDSIAHIRTIRLNGFFFQKNSPRIEALCDVSNPLCGPTGAACVFGPQKGATADEVKVLDEGLRHLAGIYQKRGAKIGALAGAGAAGGTGAGVAAFLNGRLLSGVDALLDLIRFDDLAKDADLIVTGEGCVDGQTLSGKVPAGIARRAGGRPVLLLAGASALTDAEEAKLRELGVTAVMPILQRPCALGDAVREAETNLRTAARRAFSLWKAARG